MRLLAGDIGGTKTELALFERERVGVHRELHRARYPSGSYSGLLQIVQEFLESAGATGPLDAAGFAVAGPVVRGACQTTNLPWELSERALAAALRTRVALINDFAAVVLGIGQLSSDSLCVLAEGVREADGSIAVLGAGTGLGEAIGVPTGAHVRVMPTEGGHADFAPRNDDETRLLRFIRQRLGSDAHVSVERVVSGPGLALLYAFVLEQGLVQADPGVTREMALGDPSEVVGRLGSDGGDAACERALSLFVSAYGAEAGNLALKTLPTGGLYVAGGIAPKLAARLARGDFMEAFLSKGRMTTVLERIPVSIVMNPQVGLLGARALAEGL